MEKIKSLFSDKKLLIILIVITTVAIIKVFLGFIYVKDEPKIVPEKTREDIRGVIKEDIAAPIAKVIPAVGKPFVEAAYQKPQVKNEDPSDETANWKTYRNEEYGFELRYPEEWEAIKGESESTVTFTPNVDGYDGIMLNFAQSDKDVKAWWLDFSKDFEGDYAESQIVLAGRTVSIFEDKTGMMERYYLIKNASLIYNFLPFGAGYEKVEELISTIR